MQPTIDALDAPTRAGDPALIEALGLLDAMGTLDLDPFALAGLLLDALRAEDRPVDGLLDLALELIWGVDADAVRDGSVDPSSPEALQAGLLLPLGPALRPTVSALLDDDLTTAAWAGELVSHAETKRWVHTFGAMVASADPQVHGPVRALVPHLGELLVATRSPANDVWPASSGDSLRDLIDAWYLAEPPVVLAVSGDLEVLLGDPPLRSAVRDSLVALQREGHLGLAPDQAVWMSAVDVDLKQVRPGGDSSLYAFVRLLADTNQPMECSLDLWVTDLEFSFGNLAVATLELLAGLDAETVRESAGILALLTDNQVAEWMLHQVAGTEVCPTLTHQVIDDLGAVDVMAEPDAFDLLVVFLDVLRDLRDAGEVDHIPRVADLVERLYRAGGLPSLEEALRDGGGSAAIDDLLALLPVLADPEAHGLRAGDQPPVDLDDALDLLAWAVGIDPELGLTGLERTRPLLRPLLSHDGTWVATGHAAGLLRDPSTQTSAMLDLVPPLLALDPELGLLDQLGPVLGDPALAGPFLRVLETPSVLDSLLTSEPLGAHEEVPLAWASGLIVGGALDDVLEVIDTVLQLGRRVAGTQTQTLLMTSPSPPAPGTM